MNFRTADEQLQGRNQQSRKLGNNTFLQRRGEDIAVLLHSTDVITLHPNGGFTLDSGGWRTVTTKERINSYCPVGQLAQKHGEWTFYLNGHPHPFADGMMIGPRGGVHGGGKKKDVKGWDKMKKRIKTFAQLCADSLPLPLPSGGDCLICRFDSSSAMKDTSHLLSHMEEGYVVPLLVWTALEEAGWTPSVQIIHSIAFQRVEGDPICTGSMKDIAQDAVKKAVTKFMTKRLRRGTA